MIWTVLPLLVCLALTVRLVFFMDEYRIWAPRWQRLLMFMGAVYAGKQVIWLAYYNLEFTPLATVFHVAVLAGTFQLKQPTPVLKESEA
jgi:hypothetical protein